LDPPPTKAYVPKGKAWLVSYAGGAPVYKQSVHFQVHSALNRGIDAVIMYGPRDLDEDFRRENEAILSQKRGAGYWLWKPYIILKTLQQVPENDIVFYYDAGWSLRGHIAPYLKLLESSEAVFFDNVVNNCRYVKRDCWQLMGMDASVLDELHVEAAHIFMKNTSRVRAFVKKWLTYTSDPRISTDQPSREPEDPRFRCSLGDQSALAMCLAQEERKPRDQEERLSFVRKPIWAPKSCQGHRYLKPFCGHRRRSVDRGSLFDICPDA